MAGGGEEDSALLLQLEGEEEKTPGAPMDFHRLLAMIERGQQ